MRPDRASSLTSLDRRSQSRDPLHAAVVRAARPETQRTTRPHTPASAIDGPGTRANPAVPPAKASVVRHEIWMGSWRHRTPVTTNVHRGRHLHGRQQDSHARQRRPPAVGEQWGRTGASNTPSRSRRCQTRQASLRWTTGPPPRPGTRPGVADQACTTTLNMSTRSPEQETSARRLMAGQLGGATCCRSVATARQPQEGRPLPRWRHLDTSHITCGTRPGGARPRAQSGITTPTSPSELAIGQ